jgi:hypothetical protein
VPREFHCPWQWFACRYPRASSGAHRPERNPGAAPRRSVSSLAEAAEPRFPRVAESKSAKGLRPILPG